MLPLSPGSLGLWERRFKHLLHAADFVCGPIAEEFGNPIVVRMPKNAVSFAIEQQGQLPLPLLARGCSVIPS